MSDSKISDLPIATTPLAGTEVLPIVQTGSTKQVAVSDVLSPGGLDTQVQFNNAGALGGSANFRFDTDRVAIGTGLPGTLETNTLHVHTADSGITPTSAADDLVVENNGEAGISILTPNVDISALNMGTPGRQVGAFLRWDFTNNFFDVGTGNANAEIAISPGLNQEIMRLTNANVGIGTAAPDASAILDMSSTTQGFRSPQMTTAQRDAIVSPANGLTIFNTDLNQPEIYNGTVWQTGGGFVRDTVSTTDNVFSTIATVPVAEDSVVFIEARGVGHRTNGNDQAAYVRRVVAFRIGAGSAQFEGSVENTFTRDSTNFWTIDITLSGIDVLIQVRGQTGHDINWVNRYTRERIV